VVSKTLKTLGLAGVLPQLIAEVSLPDAPVEKPNGHVLSVFGSNLTEKASRGQLSRIVERNREITALQQQVVTADGAWLLLVGQPGVGKRAVIEGLAEWIVDGLCPPSLHFRRVVEVSAIALLASTRFPSELEDRVARLLREAGSRDILFISDLRLLLAGGGSAPKVCQMIADANPVVISTMTLAEYEQAVGGASISRERFRVHPIEPPSRQAAIEMTSVHQELLELEHEVSIAPGAIDASVDLFPQMFPEKASPGGALELLRQGCVYVAESKPTGRGRSVDAVVIAGLVSRSTQVREGYTP
jgi:ATP-dependent Clp protease ATP-binding subunit ClpC